MRFLLLAFANVREAVMGYSGRMTVSILKERIGAGPRQNG